MYAHRTRDFRDAGLWASNPRWRVYSATAIRARGAGVVICGPLVSSPFKSPRVVLSPRQIRIVFGGLMLGSFLSSLDQTVVATALPTIVRDLGTASQLSWVVTAYLLTSTV